MFWDMFGKFLQDLRNIVFGKNTCKHSDNTCIQPIMSHDFLYVHIIYICISIVGMADSGFFPGWSANWCAGCCAGWWVGGGWVPALAGGLCSNIHTYMYVHIHVHMYSYIYVYIYIYIYIYVCTHSYTVQRFPWWPALLCQGGKAEVAGAATEVEPSAITCGQALKQILHPVR